MNASTTATIASPGGSTNHQNPAVAAPVSDASRSIAPHEGASGSLSPRKASVDSMMMAIPTARFACASTSGPSAGRTCRPSTCHPDAPSARTRSTDGRASIDMVCARTTRASVDQDVSPIAATIVQTPGCSTAESARASTSPGTTTKKSITRSSAASSQPQA